MGIMFRPTSAIESGNLESINNIRRETPITTDNIAKVNRIVETPCTLEQAAQADATAQRPQTGAPRPQQTPPPRPAPQQQTPPPPRPAPSPAPAPRPSSVSSAMQTTPPVTSSVQVTASVSAPMQTTAPVSAPVYTAASSPAPTPQPAAVPFKAAPAMTKLTNKGQKSPLGAKGQLSEIKLCFGWNVINPACDVDISVFMLGDNEKVPGEDWFVFYGQPVSPDKSITLNENPPDDRKMISVLLDRLDSRVKKLVFVLTINEALVKRLNFSMIKDAYARVLTPTGTELISFKVSEYYAAITSMMMCEVYLHKDQWKFNAVGNGVARDLEGLCNLYGIEVK